MASASTSKTNHFKRAKDKKRGKVPWTVLIWSIGLFHTFSCFEWAFAVQDDMDLIGEPEMEQSYENGKDVPSFSDLSLYEWLSNNPIPSSSPFVEANDKWNKFSHFMGKEKRSMYGILGLATKRPHKTAAQIQHLPRQDSFLSVRGKRKRSVHKPNQTKLLYPSYPQGLRARIIPSTPEQIRYFKASLM